MPNCVDLEQAISATHRPDTVRHLALREGHNYKDHIDDDLGIFAPTEQETAKNPQEKFPMAERSKFC